MGDRVGLGKEFCAPEHSAAGSQPSHFPFAKECFSLFPVSLPAWTLVFCPVFTRQLFFLSSFVSPHSSFI